MSPSSASSDGHGGHSNTSSVSDVPGPNPTCDALPMITTSHFESAVTASGQDVSSSTSAVPQLSAHWPKLAFPLARSVSSEHLRGQTVERTIPSTAGTGSFSSSLAVPAPAYSRVESPFHLSLPRNNELDSHPSVHAAFLLTRSRVAKVRVAE